MKATGGEGQTRRCAIHTDRHGIHCRNVCHPPMTAFSTCGHSCGDTGERSARVWKTVDCFLLQNCKFIGVFYKLA